MGAIRGFNDEYHFYIHEIKDRCDDLSNTMHGFAEHHLISQGFEPLAYFTDGTLYYSPTKLVIDEKKVVDAVASDINDLIDDDVIKFKIQINLTKPATKD